MKSIRQASPRASASARGYDSKWRRARAQFLKRNPVCVFCQARGVVTVATVVDHIRAHRGDAVLFWDCANWQALCASCHSRDKQQIENKGLKGCDENGVPLHAGHHWFVG